MTARTFLLLGLVAGCTYDPPPDVRMVAPPQNRFVRGDPIVLEFSEPVRPDSIEIRIWPGQKDLYDVEGERKPDVAPLLDTCTIAASPCPPGGVVVTQDATLRRASIAVPDLALGDPGHPLVLEVSGRLEDEAGRTKKVSRFFDFQIVNEAWDPYADVPADAEAGDVPDGGSDAPALDREVAEGAHFFFAQFTTPIELPQQFWCDVRVDPVAGRFLMVLTDADPLDGAPRNTSDPTECSIDTGPEGFLFTARGRLYQTAPGANPSFEAEVFTLSLMIGPILFELRDMVMRGTIQQVGDRSQWDGTMAVREVYYKVGDIEQVYPADQANFQIRQILGAEIPATMPEVCDADPCAIVGGKCDLPKDGPWPVPAFCP